MKRVLYYFLLILAAFMLQNNMFAAVSWIDYTPNLLIIITFATGFIRGRKEGLAVGFCCGLISDLFFSTNVGIYALIYTLIGYGSGIISQLFYTEYLYVPVLLCMLSDFLFGIYVYFVYFLLNGTSNFGYFLSNILLPELVYTTIITILIYKPLKLLNQLVEKWEKKTAKKYV